MEARIDKIEQEIAALEERQLFLTANPNTPLNNLEEAELSLLPDKLARLETRYNTLVTALGNAHAPTQAKITIIHEDVEVDSSDSFKLLPFPPVSSEDTISLSVQGSLFVLKRKTIESFDWMVARMLTSAIPSSKHDDMIYIDVDSASFRVILSILQGLTDLQLEVSRISTMELVVLKTAAEYLLCDNIVQEIEAFETEIKKLAADRDKLAWQLAESKKSDDFHIIEAFKKLPIRLMECNGYKTRRTKNLCSSKTLVIGGSVRYYDDDSIEECTKCNVHLDDFSRLCCIECSNDFSRLQGNLKKFSISSIKEIGDLADIIKKIND